MSQNASSNVSPKKNQTRLFIALILFVLLIGAAVFVIKVLKPANETFEVTLEPEFVLQGSGSNIDSIAFWQAADPRDSLMFVTVKGEPLLQVWAYPFNQVDGRPDLVHECIDNGTNGVLVDQEADALYVAVRDSANLCVFSLPDLAWQGTFHSAKPYKGEPNLGLLKLETGQTLLYVSDDDVVYIHEPITGDQIGQFSPVAELEALVGDEFRQVLYVPDENERSGVFTYDPTGNLLGQPFGSDVFENDGEGIIIYRCPPDGDGSQGFIVVSDQRDPLTDFEFFDLESKEYLGKIRISKVNNTDGIGSIQQASDRYPSGLLAVVDDDSMTAGVGWDSILAATGLQCF